MRTIKEKRAQRVEYMRRYREKNREKLKPIRQAESRRYWEENKEKILAQRKAQPRTDKQREYHRAYAKRRYQEDQAYREYQAKWHRKNRVKRRVQAQQRKLRELEVRAGRPKPNKCEICCSDEPIKFDHCHQTGKFRGWICHSCNLVLGLVKDDPDRLRMLIDYLTTRE